MLFNRLKFFYFNILLLLFFIFNNYFLFLIIIIFKSSYFINLESDVEYEFEFFNLNYDLTDAKYLEQDIDDEYIYVLLNEEFYLNFNCRFFFDFYGGTQTLDYIDYIDFIIYDTFDMRNLKNIYNFLFFKKFNNLDNSYILYNFKEDYIKDYNYIFNNLDINKLNIAQNMEAKDNVKLRQRLFFILLYQNRNK